MPVHKIKKNLPFAQILGSAIRKRRVEMGLSVRQTCREIGWGKDAGKTWDKYGAGVSRWEHGVGCPSTPMLLKLARLFSSLSLIGDDTSRETWVRLRDALTTLSR